MATESTDALQIDASLVGALALEGSDVPYVHLEHEASIQARLRVGETEYAYDRSYPVKGHSAVMPGEIAELQAEGRRVLVAERNERYYLYLA